MTSWYRTERDPLTRLEGKQEASNAKAVNFAGSAAGCSAVSRAEKLRD